MKSYDELKAEMDADSKSHPKVNIISGCNHIRFESHINHAVYANHYGYKYIFDDRKRPLKSVYDHKLHAILDIPIDDQWWFWIDDDAFFINFNSFSSLKICFEDKLFVFPKSPINPQGLWTFLSSGNFFFKNNTIVKDFFTQVLNRDINQVKSWWDPTTLGKFTNGDQDRIVFELLNDEKILKKTLITNYELFNTRPYHFNDLRDHFLVHFAGVGDKNESIALFKETFSLPSLSLVPKDQSHLEANVMSQYYDTKLSLKSLKTHLKKIFKRVLG